MLSCYIFEISNDFIALIERLEQLAQLEDPCYLGEPHNCNNCGACL